MANPRAVWAVEFLPLLAAGGLAGLLLLAQRDLGAGMLLLALLAGQIYVAYGHPAVLYGALGLLGLGAGVGALTLDVVRTRFEAWINPWLDPTGSGYQIVQSLIAIASGGLLGSGPGRGTPAAVPVVHSDFVFAAIAEEWGLVGALAVIALFAVLVGRGLRVAAGARDPFAVLLAVGISLAFGLQSLLILGGTLRVLPITGVTLPFLSYGGSSLVTSSIAAGFLVLLSSERHPGLGTFGRPILRAQYFLSAGWVALALAVGWWSIVRGEVLTARTDNPRRSLASRFSLRGSILDWEGVVLADSTGRSGSYERIYYEPATAPVTGYDSSQYGQAGIEASLDGFLRGEIGPEPLLIWWNKLVNGTPPAGFHVRLTLNSELQRAAAVGLAGRRGAVIVVDAQSGSILAMASSPSFNPSTLDQDWPGLVVRTDGPLLNRVTQGRYQPGMTLAPLLFAWGISNGMVGADLPAPEFDSPVTVFDRTFSCRPPIEPQVEPTWGTELMLACPGPFAALGEAMGPEGVQLALEAFGLLDPPQI
ncbi:MAG: FtsW/RodA/SpoVE family cell cycle protein, partial [Anaerolineales bacterium]